MNQTNNAQMQSILSLYSKIVRGFPQLNVKLGPGHRLPDPRDVPVWILWHLIGLMPFIKMWPSISFSWYTLFRYSKQFFFYGHLSKFLSLSSQEDRLAAVCKESGGQMFVLIPCSSLPAGRDDYVCRIYKQKYVKRFLRWCILLWHKTVSCGTGS